MYCNTATHRPKIVIVEDISGHFCDPVSVSRIVISSSVVVIARRRIGGVGPQMRAAPAATDARRQRVLAGSSLRLPELIWEI